MQEEKPSATALLIARSQLVLADDPAYAEIVDANRRDYYRRFVEAVTDSPWQSGWASRTWLGLIERVSIPGIYLHYALRKRCIEQISRDFLDSAQAPQVVVIAGGFDPLTAMLSDRYPGAMFFELDHPATQRAKRAVLHGRPNLTLLPVDLTRQFVADVLDGVLSPDKPTLFIAEGITMYLSDEEIDRFFEQIRSCARHDQSRFVFTYMNERRSGAIQFESATWIADWWLRMKQEVFKWGISTDELDGFLAGRGYRLLSVFDADYLAKRYLPHHGCRTLPAKGENICLAQLQC